MTKHASPIAPIIRSVQVRASKERAFRVFTTNVIHWWPPTYTIGNAPMKEVVIEPHVGGRWYEIDADGSQCQWGDVLGWSPPDRLVLAWRINMNWTFDPALLTEIEVTFTEQDGVTTVQITHSKFENFGDQAEKALQVFDGWHSVLARFVETLEAGAPE